MNFLADSVAVGLVSVLGGTGILLATFQQRYRVAELAVTYLFLVFVGVPLAGLDVPVAWAAFSEICLVVGILLAGTALVRYAQSELAEGEYD